VSSRPVVETRSGRVRGVAEEGLQVFRGIPFARPPVGPLRFAAPEPPEPWAGLRDAGEFGPSAPQRPMRLPLPGMDVGVQDEDCLRLNVTTPAADGGRRPVMVWIHGGGFAIGSGSQPIYDGAPLARAGDVVVVTLNYRLGPLGFLYLADLCPELEGAVGNAGLRDQVAGLAWVRDNIAAFGGDPDDVTIFGESAGGMSVGSLLGMPSARGLFRRAVAQSGAAHNVHDRETATRAAEQFLAELGLEPRQAARHLRELPPDKLIDLHEQTVMKLGRKLGLLAFQPMVDGDSLPRPPLEAVRQGAAADVSLLTGTTRDEWRLFGVWDPSVAKLDEAGLREQIGRQVGDAERAAEVVEAYREARPQASAGDLLHAIETDRVFRIPCLRLAEAQCAHRRDVFVYRFDWESPAFGGSLGACHAVELPFVFGVAGREGPQAFVGGGPEAERLERRALASWTAFARRGDPTNRELPEGGWPAYDPERRATMILGRDAAVELDPASRERRVWDGLV